MLVTSIIIIISAVRGLIASKINKLFCLYYTCVYIV